MVDFAKEREVLDLLKIDCSVEVVIDEKLEADVIYEPEENKAQIYASGFTDFVEAAGRLKLGIVYHPLLATPVFSSGMDFELKKIAAKITKYWKPLLAGWGWKQVRETLSEPMLEELKRDLRLELDTMAIRRMMEGKKYRLFSFIRKQAGYMVLGGVFAVRIRAGSEETRKLYEAYLTRLFELVEHEPSLAAMEEVARIFFPRLKIEEINECGSVFSLVPEE